jgi:hypothetical protein
MRRIEPSSTGSSAPTGSGRERGARGRRLRRSALCSASRLDRRSDIVSQRLDAKAGCFDPVAKSHALQKALYDRGLNLKSTGNTLIVLPAFVAERRQIQEITEKIREALVAA